MRGHSPPPAGAAGDASAGDPSLTQRWVRQMVAVEGGMSEQLARIACASAARPRLVQWGLTLLMCLSCVGFLNVRFEMRPEELWALQDSELLDNYHCPRPPGAVKRL
jgi:hypothetical protein